MDDSSNNNNNNNNNNKEIIILNYDLNNLQSLTYQEVYRITQSINLKTPKSKKVELIAQIKKFYQNKILNNQLDEDNINYDIFNLKIKEIDNLESLFWRVMKNKFLFRIILSYLPTNSINKKNYYEAIEVEWMINNNHKQLLMDKVIKNQYLLFPKLMIGYNNGTSTYIGNLSQIFSYIKQDTEENLEFYRCLFKFHWKRMKGSVNYNNGNYFKERVIELISKGCLAALRVLTESENGDNSRENLSIIINSNLLINSVKFNKFKIIKYLFQFNNQEYSKKLQLNCDYSNTSGTNNNLQIWRLIFNTPVSLIKKRFKVLNYLIQEINLKPPNDQPLYLINLFRLCPFENEFTIKVLLESCKSIQILNLYEVLKELNNNNITQQLQQTQYSIPLLNLEDLKFSEKQLKLKVCEITENEENIKENINNLLLMYYSILNGQKNQKYYLIYKKNNYIESMEIEGDNNICLKNIEIDSFKYGDNKLLRKWFNKNDNSGSDYNRYILENRIADLIENDDDDTLLFKYCKNDKDKQLKFVQDLINDTLNVSIDQESKIQPLCLFNLVLTTNNLEFVKLVFESFGNDLLIVPVKNYSRFNYNIFRYVNSIDCLNYVLDNIKNKQLCSILTLFRYGRVDLLQEYEKRVDLDEDGLVLNKLRFPTLRINGGIANTINNNNSSSGSGGGNNRRNQIGTEDKILVNEKVLKSAQYVVSRPDIYEFDSYVIECWCSNSESVWQSFDISNIKYIIENTNFNYDIFKNYTKTKLVKKATSNMVITIEEDCIIEFTLNQIKLMDWIFENRICDIISKRCKIDTSILKVFLYLTGRSDQLFDEDLLLKYIGGSDISSTDKSDIIFKNCNRLLYFVVIKGDFNFINQFMERYFSIFEKVADIFEEMVPAKQITAAVSKVIVQPIIDSIIDSVLKQLKLPTTTATTTTTDSLLKQKSLVLTTSPPPSTTFDIDMEPVEESTLPSKKILDIEMKPIATGLRAPDLGAPLNHLGLTSHSIESSTRCSSLATDINNNSTTKITTTTTTNSSNNDSIDSNTLTTTTTSNTTTSTTTTNINGNNNNSSSTESVSVATTDESIIGTIREYNESIENAPLKINPYGIKEDEQDDDKKLEEPYKVKDFKRGRSKKEDRIENKKRIKLQKAEREIEKEKKEKEKAKKDKEKKEKAEKDKKEKEEKEKKKLEDKLKKEKEKIEKVKQKQEAKELKKKKKKLEKQQQQQQQHLAISNNNSIGPIKKIIQLKVLPKKEIREIQKQFLFEFLNHSIKNGRLDIIKYIDQEYPVLLLKKSSIGKDDSLLNSIFTLAQLKTLIFESLYNDHLELFNYLTEDGRLELSPRQFKSNTTPNQLIFQVMYDNFEIKQQPQI